MLIYFSYKYKANIKWYSQIIICCIKKKHEIIIKTSKNKKYLCFDFNLRVSESCWFKFNVIIFLWLNFCIVKVIKIFYSL